MSEQSAIGTSGDDLFGRGTQAAVESLGKAYQLAFMKSLSQLSSPAAAIIDRTGHIGLAREIADYKTSLALAQALAGRVETETDPRVQAILKQLSSEYSELAASAGQRIIKASAFADESTTVAQALAEIFQVSDDFVAKLLAPTPGAQSSVEEIAGAVQDELATASSGGDDDDEDDGSDAAAARIIERLKKAGIGTASAALSSLSLGLEAHVRETGSDGWHAIAAQAGGAALLLDALFTRGYAPALEVNGEQPFYRDAGLADKVRALLDSSAVDFATVGDYLPDVQALAWLVSTIDSSFTTGELNQLINAASNLGDQAGVLQLVEDLTRIVSGASISVGTTPASFYRSVFATIDAVETAFPAGLELQGLAGASAAKITDAASRKDAQGVAYRYALTELNVFVLIGADYAIFNAGGALDLHDAATGHGTFSPEYLTDRPELLAAMIKTNLADIAPDGSGTTRLPGLGATYIDRDEGIRIADPAAAAGVVLFDGSASGQISGTAGRDRIYGEAGDDVIDGGDGDDLLDGGEGADTLFGGAGSDVLLGGAGADTLRGGAGRDLLRGGAGNDLLIGDGDGDILEGGTGFDTYNVRRGDIVRDEDGLGTINFGDEGLPISGGTQVDDSSLFVSDDGRVVYRAADDGSIDFWVDGQRVTVLPGVDDGGPRRRRDDGAPQEDQGNGNGDSVSSKPLLDMPLRRSGAPRDPSYKAPFMLAQGVPAPRRDPLVLDLDGDGFETVGQQAVTYFDHDANGFAELTGWVGSDDGFLVLDRNGDGRINDGKELFGDRTVLASGALAANGLQALAEWDLAANGGNQDGVIDAGDAVWSNLRVWRDLDGDGFSDAGELFTLTDVGVRAISLSFTDERADDGLGNTRTRAGSFTRADGSIGTIGEYLLARNTTASIAESSVALGEDVVALPEVRGAGNVYDLRQAMARDGGLKNLVSAFVQESDGATRDALLERILFRWAGADGLDPNSRGGMIDARKLVVLEQFLAESFVGALGANPVPDAAIQLERAWHDLAEQVHAKLMARSHLDSLYQQITYTFDATSRQVRADFSAVTAAIDAELTADFATGKALLADVGRMLRAMDEFNPADYQTLRAGYAVRSEELAIAFDSGGLNYVANTTGANKLDGTTAADMLVGGAGSDSVMGFDGDDVIYGLDGDDTLSGCEDNDQLFGGLGNDNLFGGSGDDVLDGGAGNDYLNGGTGNDVYILARGMGRDHVRDYDTTPGNFDVIRVAADIGRDEIRFWRKGNDLYVGIAGTTDQMRVEGWFWDAASRIEAVVFADGFQIGADLLAQARFTGTEAADVIVGNDRANYLEGLAGNDTLYGGGGDDVLDGGAGNDTLYGGTSGYSGNAGAGNDTYIFARGYGQDTIYDYDTTPGNVDTIRLVGLNRSDVTLRRDSSSFYISVNGTTDVLRVADWGLGAAYRIERIVFGDGTVLDGAALVAPFLGTSGNDTLVGTAENDVLIGLDGNDTLSGGAGDDVLDGGAGNDTLYGGTSGYFSGAGAGNDTYVFGRGYGQDVIYDYDATPGNVDTIRLKDLNRADVTIRRDTNSFYISVNGTTDVLRVADWGSGAAHRIERIQFADGSVLEGAALVAPFLGTAGNDTLIGTVENDVLMGLDGNDSLSGGAGDDVLDGGAGNDTLYGGVSGYFAGAGAGNDTYVFGRGYGQDTIYDYDTTPGNVDTIRLKDLNYADVTIRRDTNHFYLSVNGTSDVLRVADWGLGAAYRIERVEFADGTVLDGAALAATPFLGTAAGETIKGTTDSDVIRGLGGNDYLYGGAGDDLLDGGPGNDYLFGGFGGYTANSGAGNDTYVFARGYGQDTIYDFDATPGNIDTIKLLDLNAADVTIRRDASSFYIEVNGSTDRIRVADWGLGAAYRIERVEFADGSVLEGAALTNTPYLGTAGGDNLIGTADNEVMRGLDGNDTLAGGAGDDVLDGGEGNDTLKGETGNDVLIGGAGNDTLYAGDGNDLLDGGTGKDKMYGGGGDDVYWVDDEDDKVFENANEGTDTVIASINYTLGNHVENLTLIGTANLTGTGNNLDNVLRGNAGNNLLSGGAGNDYIDGGAGADTMIGGTGNDTYVVDHLNDVVIEKAGEGVDTVRSSITYSLPAEVENLILTGNAAINGTGNALNNRIEGNAGNNVLDGGAGADVMLGGAGDDTYVVDNAEDVVIENPGEGIDSVLSSVSYALSAEVEHLMLTGTAAINGTGNELNNIISGNNANNTLAGGGGDDTLMGGGGDDLLDGGAGNDLLEGGAGSDVYVFGRGYGNDTIREYDPDLGAVDTIRLIGLNPTDVTLSWDETSLVLTINDTGETLRVLDWNLGEAHRIERVQYADGTVLGGEALMPPPPPPATTTDDTLASADTTDLLPDSSPAADPTAGSEPTADAAADPGTSTAASAEPTADASTADEPTEPTADAGTSTEAAAEPTIDTGTSADAVGEVPADAGTTDAAADSTLDSATSADAHGEPTADAGTSTEAAAEPIADTSTTADPVSAPTADSGTTTDASGEPTADAGTSTEAAGEQTTDTVTTDPVAEPTADAATGAEPAVAPAETSSEPTQTSGGGAVSAETGATSEALPDEAATQSSGDETALLAAAGSQTTADEGGAPGDTTVSASSEPTGAAAEPSSDADVQDAGSSEGTSGATQEATGPVASDQAGTEDATAAEPSDATMSADSGSATEEPATETLEPQSATAPSGDTTEPAADDSVAGTGSTEAASAEPVGQQLIGTASDDLLSGGAGADQLDGGAGNDVLQGGAGDDVLQDLLGANVLDGGAGADRLTAEGISFIAGGKGDDRVAVSGTASVIAQNVGDGNDLVRASAQRVTLSLGGQLKYENFQLRKDGANLVMEIASGDSTTFEGWYDAATAKPQFLTLQVMTAAMDGFDGASSDPLLNQRVQQFDLKALADYYDAVRSEDPTVDRWSMMHKLLDARLASYDNEALGGELARAYATNASLAGVALSGAQSTIGAAGFGQQSQSLTSAQDLSQDGIKLS